MKYSVIICSALITFLGFYVEGSLVKLSRCPLIRISNGRVRQRPNGRAIRFNCNSGFTLVGNRIVTCSHGRWNSPPAICVNTQCASIVKPDNCLVVPTYNGGVLMFFCNPGYERRGSPAIYCDGTKWNDTVPTCKKSTTVTVPTSCDFENPDLCLWEQDPNHDFDWTRHNFNTPSWHVGTGPSHDHTLGSGGDGYYLYIETTGRLENSTARIMSPLYSSNLTEAGCFSFWYHMYGLTIGTLNVYFKVEDESERTLMFTQSGNQGNHWWQGLFQLPKSNDSFQIILEGIRGTGYLSDIAVDDVAILQGDDCTLNLSGTTEIVSTDGYDQVEIVNGMQTCQGKCTYTNTTDDPTSICQCGLYCSENGNCCPDYTAYCISTNDSMDSTTDSSEFTTATTLRSKSHSIVPDRIPIPIIPKDDIDPYTTKIPDKQPVRANTTRIPDELTKSSSIKTTLSWAKEAMIIKTVRTTTSTVRTIAKITRNYDKQSDNKIETAHSTSSRDRGKVTLPGIIAIVFGAIVGIAGTGLIVFLILQRRNGYKNKSGKSALSEDSDVRFLTSDEILDFNLAKPEDMEM